MSNPRPDLVDLSPYWEMFIILGILWVIIGIVWFVIDRAFGFYIQGDKKK